MNGARYDADEVRLAARAQVHTICAALGIEGRGRREIRSRTCPAKRHSKASTVSIDTRKGLWHCTACGTGGDMIDLIAAARGLDVRRQFGEVLAAAAELTGVRPISSDPFDAEQRRRDVAERAEAERRRIELEEKRDAEREAAAIAEAAATWPTLPEESARGFEYLRSRGLDPERLRRRVRFEADGAAVALHDRYGGVRNIVRRRYPELLTDEDDPRVLGKAAAPGDGTLVGHVAELDEGHDVAILTEGVIDTLTAALVWPTCVVLGAHGAGQMRNVVHAAAPRIRELRGWLMIVPHLDEAGIRNGVEAVTAAHAAGLALGRDLHLVDLGQHNDLADAVAAGWRWSWPA